MDIVDAAMKEAARITDKALAEQSATITALRKRVEELEGALEPFGGYLDTAAYDLDNKGNPLPDDHGMGWVYLSVGHFRRARALLRAKGGE